MSLDSNYRIQDKLKAANKLLPYYPVDCLKQLEELSYIKDSGTNEEKAQFHLIQGKILIEFDDRPKAYACFSEGLSLSNISLPVRTRLKMWKGYILCYQNEPELAKEILIEAIREFRMLGEKALMIEAEMYYAVVLIRNRDYAKSLELFTSCYKLALEEEDLLLQAKLCSYIFSVHYLVRDIETASKWLDKSVVINREINYVRDIIICLVKKGNLNFLLKKYDESIDNYNEAIEWLYQKSKVDRKILKSIALASLADVYLEISEPKFIEAYDLYLDAYAIAEKINHQSSFPHLLLGITKVLKGKEKSQYPFSPILDAEWFELKLNNIAKALEDNNNLIINEALWKAFSNYYRYKKDYEKSIKYMDKLMEYSEKLLKEEKSASVKILQIKNKLQEKELELKNMELQQKKEVESINKTLEKKVNERTEALRIKNKELQEYAFIVAHDLKEPIRSIVGFTQILERKIKGVISDEDLEFFGYIKNSGKHMGELVDGLLKYSTLNIDKDDLVLGDLNKILSVVLADLHMLIKENKAEVRNMKLPSLVRINKIAMKQLFQNLITNAIKFKKKNEDVVVEFKYVEKENEYLISVSDNGIGISEEYHEIIFKLFNRLHKNDGYEGTGIGLSVSKKIIEQHGGKIWLDSKENVGTTFYFTLPKQAAI